ncbi:MAG: tetratricopeptide repeat family protein [Polyangiaceae bacterium]|jgi:tetratricopeptide (TPR) repeat protein|nr:tetratricopeptide repeat family protein [Polyangiaceae bacterium]
MRTGDDTPELGHVRALYARGSLQEALQACQALLACGEASAQAFAAAGMLSLKLGDAQMAEAYYRQAVGKDARFAEAHFNLGNVLTQLGRARDAVDAFRRTLELRPGFAAAHNNLAGALSRLDEHEEADACYRRALALSPRAAHVHRNWGTALRARGQLDSALECFARAAALEPSWPKALQSLATAAMELGRWTVARQSCERWLAQAPGNVEALGLWSIALDELGERATADELLDTSLMTQRELREAPGGGSLREFNAALGRAAHEDPSLRVPEANDARYHCPTLFISGEVRDAPGDVGARLQSWVSAQVEEYVRALREQVSSHPFTRAAPERWELKSWFAVLAREGQLEPHVHYDSYVSAVYYVHVPRSMQGGAHAGSFELSGGPSRFPCRHRRAPFTVKPREGLLLLFPSYFYHRTLPFHAAQPRISVAFDAVPLGSKAQ